MIHLMEEKVKGLYPYINSLNWTDENVYADWLSQAYYMVRKSVPYLGLCIYYSADIPEFMNRCKEHIAEESNHEKLILNDLKVLGRDLAPELSSTTNIYQTQFYKITHISPISFLGYVFLLELLAPMFGPHVISQVANKKALSFLKVHTNADEDHVESAKQVFNSLDRATQNLIYENFNSSLAAYKAMLVELGDAVRTKQVA